MSPPLKLSSFLLPVLAVVIFAAPTRAQWQLNGAPVCTAANTQQFPMIVGDGAGGAIITWQDYRSSPINTTCVSPSCVWDIYAQHVLASGAVDPAWPADGRALCTAAYKQGSPTIVGDGAGGAIVTWEDYRSGTNSDIYAQRVLASGAVDPAWPADGRALSTAAGDQQIPTIVGDGAGGAIVTWQSVSAGIHAQHVLASGAVDPAWPADGRALCTPAYDQGEPTIVGDGAGGAIVTWQDPRSGTNYDIYAQHVLASGAVDPAWPADGRALCTAANDQYRPQIVADGAGGAIVTWYDYRNGTNNWDIYAQHVLASGAVDPAWPADGRAVCTAAYNDYNARIVGDGAGGAVVTWMDGRSGTSYDIYAQHVLASGAVDPVWPVDGRALCTDIFSQYDPAIVGDGAGGAIVTWWDARASGPNYDIYAALVLADGTVSTLASLVDAAAEPGVVRLHWYSPDGSVSHATVERAEGAGEFVVVGEVEADGAGHLRFEDHDVTAGATYQYRLAVPDGASPDYLGQVTIRVPAAVSFGIEGVRPNPTEGAMSVAFALASAAPARLEVLDVAGRRVLAEEVGALGPGEHVLPLEKTARLPAGIYTVRLSQSGRSVISRAAIVR